MSAEYVKKVNDKPLAASEAVPSSPLETTVNGKLNVDGSNATQTGSSAIVKTLGNGSDNLWNGDRFPANGHSGQGTNPDDFTLRSTDHLLNFLFRKGTGGYNYADLDTSMKEFGHAYGATISSDTGCYGWKIGETSHTSGYSSAAFKAIVVVWEWDAPNWEHDGYSGRNFVGVLDIVHRITESTISDSADKKIGTLTCISPMHCANSNGNRGYTVFVKQAADTHKAEWYIGRNTASANMNSKIQYGRISIFPIMEHCWKKFIVQQNSSISFNSDKDEYWGNRNVPFFSYSNYSGVGSTNRPVYVKANGELAPTTGVSADHVAYDYINEINNTNVPTTGNKDRHWFNYRNGDTNQPDPNNLLTDYYFGNRNNSTNGVYLHADGFAPRIITGGNANVLPFAKFNMTNTGTAKGFIHFKCVFMGTNDDDSIGQVDITLKIRQNEWHALGLKCVRNGGAGSLNYGDIGNYVYWSSGTTVYLGVRPGSWGAKLCVFVQYCELNGTATYTLGNYLSEVSGLAIVDGDNRDVSIPKIASQAYNVRSINIENYLQIEIKRGNNHRHASITIFGDNGSYPFIANIGFQYLSSPSSGESAGFQTPPVLSMVECNNLSSNAYVPNVWYINNGSSGSSYIYCKWSSNKRLTVLLNTFAPAQIVLSDVSSLPSGAVAAENGHSIPHITGINTQVGSSSLPVYVSASGNVSPVGSQLVLPGATASAEGYVRVGYGDNNSAYLDANSTKTGLWCKTNINSGDANGAWVCYRDSSGNNIFNGTANKADKITDIGSTSNYINVRWAGSSVGDAFRYFAVFRTAQNGPDGSTPTATLCDIPPAEAKKRILQSTYGSAVGGPQSPVYVDSNGNVVPCSSCGGFYGISDKWGSYGQQIPTGNGYNIWTDSSGANIKKGDIIFFTFTGYFVNVATATYNTSARCTINLLSWDGSTILATENYFLPQGFQVSTTSRYYPSQTFTFTKQVILTTDRPSGGVLRLWIKRTSGYETNNFMELGDWHITVNGFGVRAS